MKRKPIHVIFLCKLNYLFKYRIMFIYYVFMNFTSERILLYSCIFESSRSLVSWLQTFHWPSPFFIGRTFLRYICPVLSFQTSTSPVSSPFLFSIVRVPISYLVQPKLVLFVHFFFQPRVNNIMHLTPVITTVSKNEPQPRENPA